MKFCSTLAGAVISFLVVVDGLRKGKTLDDDYEGFSRAKQPVGFWIEILFYGSLGIFCATLFIQGVTTGNFTVFGN